MLRQIWQPSTSVSNPSAVPSAEAKTDVDLRVDNFLIAMEAADFPLDAIKAGQVRVSPRYNYRDGQQEFSGYTASRSLTVAVEDLSKLGNAMDIALAQNIDGINQIQYGTSLEAQLREQARVQAIADSKEKAEMLASAYDADLGPIISIHYQSQNPPTTLYEGDAMLMQQARARSDGQYLPDQVSFSDSISVIFELIPRN